jgi:hypothetical protein
MHRDAFAKAVEPRCGSERVDRLWHVDLAAFGGVLLAVAEHVAQGVADLARRLQDVVVVAVGEHAAAL